MSEIRLDEATFAEVKASQEDGLSSKDIAKNLGLRLPAVNVAMKSETFDDYDERWNEKAGNSVGENDIAEDDEEIEEEPQKQPSYSVLKKGGFTVDHYKGLIAAKAEENGNLKEMRGFLLEQVSVLKKTVRFLEIRKAELDTAIKSMEHTIVGGINVLEQLEKNEGFTKLSPKIERLNR
jgi:hypothetical protein